MSSEKTSNEDEPKVGLVTKQYLKNLDDKVTNSLRAHIQRVMNRGDLTNMSGCICSAADDPAFLRAWTDDQLNIIIGLAMVQFYTIVHELQVKEISKN